MSWPNPSVTGFTCNLCPAEVSGVSYQTGLTGLNGSDKKWKPFNDNFLVPGPDPVNIFYWTCCLLLWAAEFALILPIWKCWQHNSALYKTQTWEPRGQQPEQPCLSHSCSPAASPSCSHAKDTSWRSAHISFGAAVPAAGDAVGQQLCTVPSEAPPWHTAVLHHSKDFGLVGSLAVHVIYCDC